MKNNTLKVAICVFSALTFLIFSNFMLQKIQLNSLNTDAKITFKIRNLGVMVDGSLDSLNGTIQFNPAEIAKANIDVTVPISTINTGIGARNKHLQAKEYFNAAEFPFIKIKSKTITLTTPGNAVMLGTLTIKGTEKPVQLNFTYEQEPNGIRLKSDFSIKRRQFKVGSKRKNPMKDDVEVKLNVFVK